MKLVTLILTIIFVCGLAIQTFGEENQHDPALLGQLADIQQALFNDRFEEALTLCSLVIQNNPDHPAGYSFMAATQMARMTDNEENIYGEQFEKLIDTTITISQMILENQSPSQKAWTYLWMGNAHAYQALYDSRFGSFYGAIKSGMRAKDSFQAGRDIDSTNQDLLVGLGSYHYWKSAKAGILRWIGIFKNQKQQGINELRIAFDSATLFSEAARRAMVWIWLNEKEYDSVIVSTKELSECYPEGKAVLWPMAEALVELERYPEAIDVYKTLRSRLAQNPGNFFNLIECDYLLCETFKKLSQDNKAIGVAGNLNEYAALIPEDIRKRQKKRLKYLRRLNQ